ncbi:UPF0691 protein C9orf116-like protein [Trichoplax sp. H2]|nr:UPF0691 protein C9orf116-like protein [Trichoplax sp. H2]|eukprot:RDD43198.1 UPF0691 protein C9orf116-like protein [Trichoplax sp. H2]
MADQGSEDINQGKPQLIKEGATTSEFYRTSKLPERFNNPAIDRKNPVSTSGNPIFTCQREVTDIPTVSLDKSSDGGEWFKGYTAKPQHPMYRTTSSQVGSHPPTVHTMPTQYHAKSQKFSQHLGQCGMTRNQSLNTAIEKSRVFDK